MNKHAPHILLLEPYHGGSHRAFLQGLRKNLPFRFSLVSLPARKWKMRMQLAAPWMAEEIASLVRNGERFDAILCSSFMDVATLRVLLAREGITLPLALYFHENQFAYPNRINDSASYQFTALNFTSALSADSIAFNSNYNRETFMEGVRGYLRKAVDMDINHRVEELQNKSLVLYPGIDFSEYAPAADQKANAVPVIVWNHRWEHDKDPETFFEAMMELAANNYHFKLIVLGQHFKRCPKIFARSRDVLKKHLLHFGYASDRSKYIRLLHQADIVASTAIHEFFGMAVLEAVRCGCRPLVPDRLSYRELFPPSCRYPEGDFSGSIARELNNFHPLDRSEILELTDQYSWRNMAGRYEKWLLTLLQQFHSAI